MDFAELSGARFQLALDRLRDGHPVRYHDLSLALLPDGRLEVAVQSKWQAGTATESSAREDLVRAERNLSALLSASGELAGILEGRRRVFVVVDDSGKGGIALARQEDGRFRWLMP